MHGQQNDKYTEMHGQQNDKYTDMHGQQNDKYTEMHGQQNDIYTDTHGKQNVKSYFDWMGLFQNLRHEVKNLQTVFNFEFVPSSIHSWAQH
jgi:hypothetical protein